MTTGSKADVAYVSIRDKILSGGLAPGTVIPQRELAAEIGVSTTPLREGLRRLASEGLVDFGDRKIARIRELRTDDARNLLEVRRSLDPLAASLAAERRSNADMAEIRTAGEGLTALSVNPGIDELLAHRRFHAAIYRASQNDLLISVLDRLWDQADRPGGGRPRLALDLLDLIRRAWRPDELQTSNARERCEHFAENRYH